MTRPIYWADGPMTKDEKEAVVSKGFTIVDARFKPAEPIAQADEAQEAAPTEKPKRIYKRKVAK